MGQEECPKDDASEVSTCSIASGTATSASTVADDPDETFSGLIPGSTYIILERQSLRAITLTKDGLCLKDMQEGQDSSNRWLCVERSGWLGLQDPKSGKYMGHNGNGSVRAVATDFHAWECITTRDRPGGVYQLLVPHWWETLRTIVVAEDGESLITRQHGETLWRFLKTSRA
ncbi:putative Fascin domain-containing protein [Seiridium cardinale]|uniref:Fascin domain-containing protein n=1 Tax=Seiridium cardinale TaxID=138064 RepID=A0ABR2XPY9_9PEZI